MYDSILQNFKDNLICRKIGKTFALLFGILSSVLIIISIIQCIFNAPWWASLIEEILFIAVGLLVIISITYHFAKPKLNLCYKDFPYFLKNIHKLNSLFSDDVKNLLPLIKNAGIDTRAKVLETLRHFQLMLLTKNKHGFTITSVVAIVLSSISFILPAVPAYSIDAVLYFLLLIIGIIFYVILVCLALKFLFVPLYHDLSEYAIYERIEKALSEIWIKQLVR